MKRVLVSATLAAAAMTGGLAQAEGSWESSLSGVLTGFESRTWTDKNNDGAATTVRLTSCTRVSMTTGAKSSTSATVEVRRVVNNLPDVFLGSKGVCGVTGNWGDVTAGTYRWRVKTIGGQESGYRLSATKVTTAY